MGCCPTEPSSNSSVLGKVFNSCQAVHFCSHTGTRIRFMLVQPAELKMWGEWEAVGWAHFPCKRREITVNSLICYGWELSMFAGALFRPLLNMSWSSSNYCPSVITPAQERLQSCSSTAQNWAAVSVLLQSCLGHRGVSALWARLLATGDDLSQNGKQLCSQPTTLDETDHRVPPAFTDRT